MNFKQFRNKYEKIPVEEYSNTVSHDVLVSVCVQTYQHVGYIAECLDSILAQKTNFKFEILLGEDQSTDGTRDICLEYARKYPDTIRLFLHRRENNIKINGSPTGRFNFVNNLFSTRGKYIAVCEGDDYWINENKLQKQVDFLERNPSYNITGHNIQTLYDNGNIVKSKYFTYRDGSYFLYKNFTPTLSLLFRKTNRLNTIPSYLEKTPMADFPLWYFVGDSLKVKKFREIMGVRRIHSGGVWSQLDELKIYEKGINAREVMRPEIKEHDIKLLEAGINRLKVKRYLLNKTLGNTVDKPQLVLTAKYLAYHEFILSLGEFIKNKELLKILNKSCDYIFDFCMIIKK